MPSSRSLPAHLDSVHAGEHQIEHDRVILGRARHPERVLARRGDVGSVRFLLETAPKERSELHLVFDDQHAHSEHCRPAKMRAG